MNEKSGIDITPPALPKTGGAIQSIGKGWGAVGTDGAASLTLGLPISNGRGFAPALALNYRSGVGNSPFSIGWALDTEAITLRTTKGMPTYDGNDHVVGPGGDVWMPERDHNGDVIHREVTAYNGSPLDATWFVVRHWPRVEGGFDLIEHWHCITDPAGFWLIHAADGSLHMYGKTSNSRRADPNEPTHVGVWMICESLNTRGEHIVFDYKQETDPPAPPQNRDYRAQRYLRCVYYGNEKAHPHLYALVTDSWKTQHWHFQLVFDYGERNADLEQVPTFEEQQPWPERSDPFWNYAYGFELGTRRLCRQVLMFHHFPKELGDKPVLVQRLLLDHRVSPLGYHHLTAAHVQAFDSLGQVEHRPPMEFRYNPFKLDPLHPGWTRFENMPGLNDGQQYQLVDLYGEGMPGVLCNYDNAWYYREPVRCETGGDDVCYSDWRQLPEIPHGDTRKPIHQSLIDLTGDGKLDWLVAMPGMCGFFTLDPDRNWSNFVPFDAFPSEFFHPTAKMADLVGDGLSDMALIGTRSVRLYANRRVEGFANGIDVPHDDDDLPVLSNTPTELVAFADMLGCGQAQLVRIRHNEVKCWPNLGHGRFGKGFVLCSLPFAYDTFNAAQLLLADLDGSGAVDLIYVRTDDFQVFMNHAGNGYEPTPDQVLPWPDGIRYDALCQVSTADLQGLGCSSLILTVPHMSPRHWRYDFINAKPYLINATCNNMGASSRVTYRSSAQYWQDEKCEQRKKGITNPVCQLPFAMHLVSRQTQIDEISGNQLTQAFKYGGGFYDRFEREFRGFRLLEQTDTEATPAERATEGFTAPIRSMSWFHVGDTIDPPGNDYYQGDGNAIALRTTLLQQYHLNDRATQLLAEPDEGIQREIARCLAGRLLRSEIYAADDDPETAVPYVVTASRALVRVLRPTGEHHPYAVLQPLGLEAIRYRYEPQIPDDPLCEHSLDLEWDEYGSLTHGITVHYARRKIAADTPPFADEHEQRYWKDAHDDAQQCWYMTQNKACPIHHLGEPVANVEAWRLGMAYQQRSNALACKKTELSAEQIYHENILEWCKDGGTWADKFELTGLSMQLYMDPTTQLPLAPGKATFEGLTAHTVTAELDKAALSAYDKLKSPEGQMPFNLKEKLESVGYHIMDLFLPKVTKEPVDDPTDAKNYLWAVHKGFPVYDELERFFNVKQYRETQSHGETTVVYDDYSMLIQSVTLPDSCTTRILDVDYRTFLPAAIEDANRNIQEARYSAFGEPLVTSVRGTELGKPVGFDPLDRYEPPPDRNPAIAIADKNRALGRFASAGFWDMFCWMGRVSQSAPPSPAWLEWAVREGFILPSGHLRDRARQHLEGLQDHDENERFLQDQIDVAHRAPPYAVNLLSDRYTTDEDFADRLVRVNITCLDGFGRVLQTKQEVEPGKSWRVDENGCLILGPDDKPLEEEVQQRWRVSEPVEYNNKGQKVRIYRPYFADSWHYIDDRSMRRHAYHDRQFYDAAGRLTETVLAREMLQGNPATMKPLRRALWYWIWCTVAFDENDLYEPPAAPTKKNPWTLH